VSPIDFLQIPKYRALDSRQVQIPKWEIQKNEGGGGMAVSDLALLNFDIVWDLDIRIWDLNRATFA